MRDINNRPPTKRDKWGCLIFGLLCGIILAAILGRCVSEAAALERTLANPSMELPYFQHGAPEVEAAYDWTPWYVEGEGYHRPEFKPMTESDRVFHGEASQKTFTVYALHDGGVYQHIEGLVEGEWYQFSCMVKPLTSNGKSWSVVGVNSWGSAWPTHWTTNWGRPLYNGFGEWHEVGVVFEAWSDKAVVFTRGIGEWAVQWQDWYWDACVFVSVEAPEPGSTPSPIPTGTPDPPGTCVVPSIGEIRAAMRAELQLREPVRWPRD